ncbi:MAG: sterol desaturase family protein [Phaeodactylibacter sp.]|nr:sterol desaturase family protein [Phaeodactylibacter sp.]MCB9273351.1 sterol desaturase family protein [Lewinellaceae bacterium]
MYILIEKFGLIPGWLLGALIVFLRYSMFAGITFSIFYVLKRQAFQGLKIQEKFPRASHMLSEARHSAVTAFVFALMGVGIYLLRRAGYTHLYSDISAYGWGYLLFSFVFLVLLHDTYFYWVHRLMHHRKLFRLLHRVHHLSHNPTPWASLSFHPLEAFLEIAIVPVAVLLMPFHPLVLFAFATWALFWNIIGHLGYELFPKGFVHHPVWRWLNTSTHHNMHHSRSHCNYGLYFNFWDTLMGTNHRAYRATFDHIKERRNLNMKMMLSLLLLLSLPLWATAQQNKDYGTPEERATRMTERMEQALPLNPGQVTKVHAINLKYARRIQEEAIDTEMNKLSAYFRIQKINQIKEKELLPLFDEKQKRNYESLKSEAKRQAMARFF